MKEIWYLECIDLFKILCPHKYKEYKNCHAFSKFNKSEFIYFNEDASSTVFLITSGKVKLGYYTDAGDEVVKAILSKGEVFGEKAFLGEEKRNEFAQVIDNNTEVCPISVDTLHDLTKDNKKFTLSLYKLINFRIKKLERRLEILLFKDLRKRVEEFLLELEEMYGKKIHTGEIQIIHPYSQKDMACLIGSSRSSLNIILNKLQNEGFLSFQGKEILLKK